MCILSQMAARSRLRTKERAMSAWRACMAEAQNACFIADAFAGSRLSNTKPALPYLQAWQQRTLHMRAKREQTDLANKHAQCKAKQKAFDSLVEAVEDRRWALKLPEKALSAHHLVSQISTALDRYIIGIGWMHFGLTWSYRTLCLRLLEAIISIESQ